MSKHCLLFLFVLLNACSTTIVLPLTPAAELPPKEEKIYIAVPPDGSESRPGNSPKVSHGSGRAAAETVHGFLKDNGYNAFLSVYAEEDRPDALNHAAEEQADYMVYPEVNLWIDQFFLGCMIFENRTQQTMVDEADINLTVYDVRMRKIVMAHNLNSYGCPARLVGLIPIGTTTPEGQLKKALKEWLKQNETPE